ncbi:MAG: phosphotransferase, partial [Myxococcota bacterium]
HSDFKVSNLMVKREGGVWSLSAVVDWEFAFAGPPLLDVGMMLRDEERLPPGFAAGFIDGFSSAGGVLPPRWRRAAELLDLVNLCGFLAMDDQVERPHLIADARRLVLDTLTRAPGGTEL